MNTMFGRLMVVGCVAAALNACVSHQAGQTIRTVLEEAEIKTETAKALTPTQITVKKTSDIWVAGKAFRVSDRDTLPAYFRQRVVFSSADDASIIEVVESVGRKYGLRTQLTSDGLAYVTGAPVRAASSEANPPTVTVGTMGGGIAPLNARVSLPQYEGTLIGLLDMISVRTGLFWKFEDNYVRYFRTETKTFDIDDLPGASESVAEIANSVVGEKGGTSLSSMKSQIKSAPGSHWPSIEKAVKAMLSPEGSIVLSERSGMLHVTDNPMKVEQIGRFIADMNKQLTKSIAVQFEIYDVVLNDGEEYGSDLSLIFNPKIGDDYTYGLDTRKFGFSNTDAGAGNVLNLGVISPSSSIVGSQAFVKALQKVGEVSTRVSKTIRTVNGSPVPLADLDEIHYISRISSNSQTAGGTGLINQSTESAIITEGVAMHVTPRILSTGDMMVGVTVNLSSVTLGYEKFGENRVGLPQKNSKSIDEKVKVRAGETIVLTSMARTISETETKSIAGKQSWMLGGSKSGSVRKVLTVVLMTPYPLARGA